MADLQSSLASFGMGYYYQRFVEAGFDTWETLLDITEDDLESLDVQRGHRRRLQQEIASTLRSGNIPDPRQSKALRRLLPGEASTVANQKRHYNRHPRPDPNAPQRPLSAYVLFSNAVRDELKDQPLSFAEKSRVVGDRWQNLPDASKESWQEMASGPWEKYKADREQYQQTESHREYQAYLAEFNASQPQRSRKRKGSPNDPPSQLDSTSSERSPEQTSPSASHQAVPLEQLAPPAGLPFSDLSAMPSQKSERNRPKGSMSYLRRASSPNQPAQAKASQRFSHACESCKKRKLKCNGTTPACERCSKMNRECSYAGGIRDKEKRSALTMDRKNRKTHPLNQ